MYGREQNSARKLRGLHHGITTYALYKHRSTNLLVSTITAESRVIIE